MADAVERIHVSPRGRGRRRRARRILEVRRTLRLYERHTVATEERAARKPSPGARVWGQKLGQSEEARFLMQRDGGSSEYEASQALCGMLRRGRRAAAAMLLAGHGLPAAAGARIRRPRPRLQVSKPAIAQEGVLRVGVNASNAPLAGQPSSSTKIVGIDVDMAAALGRSAGPEARGRRRCHRRRRCAHLRQGRHGHGRADKSDSPSFWTSDTYLPTAVALFAQSSNSTVPANSAATKIAAQVSSNSAWAVTNEFDNCTITTTEDLKSAFSALAVGPGAVCGRRRRGGVTYVCEQRRHGRAHGGAHAVRQAGTPWACSTATPSSSRPFRTRFPRMNCNGVACGRPRRSGFGTDRGPVRHQADGRRAFFKR